MKTEHKGISLTTACKAIKDSRDKANRASEENQILIEQTIKQFEFADYNEFIEYWMENYKSLED